MNANRLPGFKVWFGILIAGVKKSFKPPPPELCTRSVTGYKEPVCPRDCKPETKERRFVCRFH